MNNLAESNNVTHLKPREKYERYRGTKIIMTFDPTSKRIHWQYEMTRTMTRTIVMQGENADWSHALRAAKRSIDRAKDGEA